MSFLQPRQSVASVGSHRTDYRITPPRAAPRIPLETRRSRTESDSTPYIDGELATAVVVTGADGYRMVFAIAEFDPAFTDRVAIVADRRDGAPLPPNAAFFQLVITGEKRPARWVRQVVAIELMSHAARVP